MNSPDFNCPKPAIRLEQSDVSQQNPAPGSEIILYQTEDGRTRLQVKLRENTVWLSAAGNIGNTPSGRRNLTP